ncbi:MAG: hypothetical protein ACI9XJ_002614, partial [Marivirga sp.]
FYYSDRLQYSIYVFVINQDSEHGGNGASFSS